MKLYAKDQILIHRIVRVSKFHGMGCDGMGWTSFADRWHRVYHFK